MTSQPTDRVVFAVRTSSTADAVSWTLLPSEVMKVA